MVVALECAGIGRARPRGVFRRRFAACTLPLVTAACSTAEIQSSCLVGPGPSLDAVVALGSDVAPFDGATIQVCRNGGACAEATFVLSEPIPFPGGLGSSFPPHEDYFVTATIWNEGTDGYVLDVTYLAEVPPPTDGDTYSVTVTSADAGPVVSLAGTATYTHVPNCAGGFSQFRLGVPCPDHTAAPECPSDWDAVECKCRAP
jgi:hypothetical protein